MKWIKQFWIAFWLTLALVMLVIVGSIVLYILANVLSVLPGLGWVEGWMIFVAALIFGPHIPERFTTLPFAREIRGSVVIDAPLAEVWHRVMPRAGAEHYLNTIKQVDDLGPGTVGLTFQDPDANVPRAPLRTRIDILDPMTHFRLTYENSADYPSWTADLVSSEYLFEDLDGRTRLTLVESLDKLRLSALAALIALNPCKDALRRAKALCEGKKDKSWIGRLANQLEPDIAGKTELQSNARSVGFMMCVLVAVLFTAMIYGVLALATAA